LRRLDDEKSHDLYTSSNVIRMRWARHAARMGRRYVHISFCWGKLKERDHLEETSVDGRITLKWIFMEYVGVEWIHLS
jgi:hypothetical protein